MADKTHAEHLAEACNAMADEQELIHLNSWVEIRNLFRATAAELRRLSEELADAEAALAESGAAFDAERKTKLDALDELAELRKSILTNTQVREAIRGELAKWDGTGGGWSFNTPANMFAETLAARLGIDMNEGASNG